MDEKKPVEDQEVCAPFVSGTKFITHYCEYCYWARENKDKVDELTEEEKNTLEHKSAEEIVKLLVNDNYVINKQQKINDAVYHLPLQQRPVGARSSCTILQVGKQKIQKK